MNVAYPSRLIQLVLLLGLGLSMGIAAENAWAQSRKNEKKDKDPLLSEDDISLIKVYEIDLDADPPPRVTIPRDTLRKFIKAYQEDDPELRGKSKQDAFLRSKGYLQLGKFFEHRAREYYKDVRIRSQIKSLRAFSSVHRTHIIEYFQPNFAAGQIPELFLFPRVRGLDADRLEMTNFYILTQTSIDGKPLIDRNEPEESLLLQWALPREEAKYPVPDTLEKWRPRFRDTDDKRYKEILSWINSLIEANQGSNYGITYTPPKHKKSRND